MKKIEIPKYPLTVPDKNSEYKVPNLDRGLSVLEYLTDYPDGLTVSEISRQLEIPKNSCHRIMMTMMSRGFLFRHEKSKKFSLTQKLFRIGSCAIGERKLNEEAIDVMRELRDLVGETVLLNCRIETHGVVLEQITSLNPIRLVVDPGTHFDLHSTAPGKLLLAFTSKKEQVAILNTINLTRYTPNTVVCKQKLQEELDVIKEQGVAYDRTESIDGMNCLSAPIFKSTGECIAALTVSGTTGTIPQSRFKELTPIVINHAFMISRRLGYDK